MCENNLKHFYIQLKLAEIICGKMLSTGSYLIDRTIL